MALYELPLGIRRELQAIRRGLADPDPVRTALDLGWAEFSDLWIDQGARLEEGIEAAGLGERMADLLADAHWVRGEVLVAVDFRSRGREELLRALDHVPGHPQALASLVRLETAHGHLRDAALHYFRLGMSEAGAIDLEMLGEDLREAVEDDLEVLLWDRIEASRKRLREDPTDREAALELAADFHFELLDLDQAERVLDELLRRGCEDPEAWLLGAEVAFEAGRPEIALTRARRGLASDSGESRSRFLATNVLASLGRAGEAMDMLRSALAMEGEPIRLTEQDLFFQARLADGQDYHSAFLAFLERGTVDPEGLPYHHAPGTPESFFADPVASRRVYHQIRRLEIRGRDPACRGEVEAEFERLSALAPEYTLLLDAYARFLLASPHPPADRVARAHGMASRAVGSAERSGESEARFRDTLEAAERSLAGA